MRQACIASSAAGCDVSSPQKASSTRPARNRARQLESLTEGGTEDFGYDLGYDLEAQLEPDDVMASDRYVHSAAQASTVHERRSQGPVMRRLRRR